MAANCLKHQQLHAISACPAGITGYNDCRTPTRV